MLVITTSAPQHRIQSSLLPSREGSSTQWRCTMTRRSNAAPYIMVAAMSFIVIHLIASFISSFWPNLTLHALYAFLTLFLLAFVRGWLTPVIHILARMAILAVIAWTFVALASAMDMPLSARLQHLHVSGTRVLEALPAEAVGSAGFLLVVFNTLLSRRRQTIPSQPVPSSTSARASLDDRNRAQSQPTSPYPVQIRSSIVRRKGSGSPIKFV